MSNGPTPTQKRAFYNEAKAHLVEKHQDDFHWLLGEIYEDNGYEYERPLTEQEKAEQKIDKLIAEHPELAKKYRVANVKPDAEQAAWDAIQEPAYPDPIDDAELDPGEASELSP